VRPLPCRAARILRRAAAAPPRCTVCWAPGGAARCERCGDTPPAFTALHTLLRFVGSARGALLEAKFRGVTELLEPLAAAAASPAGWNVEIVVLVPLHAGRQRRRGYNQAELAARAVARALDLPLERSLLWRVWRPPPQTGLGAGQRDRNLRGAFVAAGWSPPRLLLVDGITTTGTTFEAGAVALRQAGAEAVYALALARED